MDELIVTNPNDAAFLLEQGYVARIIRSPINSGIAWAFPTEAKETLKEEH